MTNTSSANWTALNTGDTTGHTLGSTGNTTYYYASDNLSFTNITAGGSGLTILGTVFLYVPGGVTITCTGVDGSGTTGGGAGIELNSGNTLYLLGSGAVNAAGGRASDGGNGGDGEDAYFVYNKYCQPGSGGSSGDGGGGAGAGVGTRGGAGGTGGSSVTARRDEAESTNHGVSGDSGNAGSSPGVMGNLFVVASYFHLTATGGTRGLKGWWGMPGDCAAEDPYNQYSASGGGGGGGGGFGGAAYDIGSGGPGGGGGAAGNSQWRANATNGFYRVGAGGGGAGMNGDGTWAVDGKTNELTNPWNAEHTKGLAGNYSDDGWEPGNGMYPGGAGGAAGAAGTAGTVKPILAPDQSGDYFINNTNEWDVFAAQVTNGFTFDKKTVKLTSDISVSTMAGSTEFTPFRGTFLGGGHTVTGTIHDDSQQGIALFSFINGATIKDLKVVGSFTSNQWYVAALVGIAKGTDNHIENCVVMADIHGVEFVGGIVGSASGIQINMTGCVYSGLMTGATAAGAFVGYTYNGNCTFTDCLYLMADGQTAKILDIAPCLWSTCNFTRCYKTSDQGWNGTVVRSITGAPGVSVTDISPVGDAVATYNVSGITAYDKGITCGDTFYFGKDDEVNFHLSSIATVPVEYYASAGTLSGTDPYTLAMPDSDVVIHVNALQTVSAGKWYVLSTPMHDQGESYDSIARVENLTVGNYDLFRYNETTAKWENQKAGDGATGFDILAIGHGYIYRCSDDRTLVFKGELNSADSYSVNLTATKSAGELKGFNLIGNPYPFPVHLNRDYYSLNPDGTVSEHFLPHNDSLQVGQGALVYTADGEPLTFYASTRSTNAGTRGLPPMPKNFSLTRNDGSTVSPEDNNQPFAHISGDQLIIEGSGTLRVYDATGRLIFLENVAANQPVNRSTFPQAGVYFLLLNEQSQKIIIR